jgi:hypothetical protein
MGDILRELNDSYGIVSETEIIANIEEAYKGLLEQRKSLILGINDKEETLTEDELLVNTNLQTASLFTRLNNEFKHKQSILDEYNTHLKTILDIPSKIATNIDTLRKVYVINSVESVDGIESVNSLNTLNNQITEYFKDTNTKISYNIQRKIMDLEIDLESISRKLNTLRSLILTGVNQIIKPEDVQKKMCPVCFENEVNTAMVPCGHTYCKGCSEADRSRYARCPQCRSQINARIKIFFSI